MGLAGRPGPAPDASAEIALREAGFRRVAGVDEVGRGAWAGPLVAAAVILPPPNASLLVDLEGVRDSKLLLPARRSEVFERVLGVARAVGIGFVSPERLDLIGVRAANELAMIRALRALPIEPDHVLVDALRLRACGLPQTAIVQGDARCLTIAAASVVAKVTRDRWMEGLDRLDPRYGLRRHKGYGAAEHGRALRDNGVASWHRYSFGPIAALLDGGLR